MREFLCGDETIQYLDFGGGYINLYEIKFYSTIHTCKRMYIKLEKAE